MAHIFNEHASLKLVKHADFFSSSKGQIAGHSIVSGSGYTTALGTVSNTTVWTGNSLYTYLAAATFLTLSSSSANDTAAGTGARTVFVQGLDGNYNVVTETMSLNGTSAVATANQYLRVFKIFVLTAGTTTSNEGTLYLGSGTITAGVPANKYAVALIGENNSFAAMYTVPAGFTAYVTNAVASMGKGKDAQFSTWVRPFGMVMRKNRNGYLYQSSLVQVVDLPQVLPEKTDVEIRGISSAPATDMSFNFDIVLVDNNYL